MHQDPGAHMQCIETAGEIPFVMSLKLLQGRGANIPLSDRGASESAPKSPTRSWSLHVTAAPIQHQHQQSDTPSPAEHCSCICHTCTHILIHLKGLFQSFCRLLHPCVFSLCLWDEGTKPFLRELDAGCSKSTLAAGRNLMYRKS